MLAASGFKAMTTFITRPSQSRSSMAHRTRPLGLPLMQATHVTIRPSLRDRIDRRIFNAIWSRSLVYNTCWEDPAVDHQALKLGTDDVVLVITSAGCNALDYALRAPRRIHCVDANPRQNALLELKIAAIRTLAFEDFFRIFGEGYHERFECLYLERMRAELSPFAQAWWDRHTHWFTSGRGSFYFHGLSGVVARCVRGWFKSRPKLRAATIDLLEAGNLDEQRRIYDERVAPMLWNRAVNWTISRQFVMNLLGVPHPQRRLVEAQHAGGVAGFIRESVQYVFRQLPLRDNYFWRVYLTGRYGEDCCPEYLKRGNFERLKSGLVDCIRVHTATVTGFLQQTDEHISRFVLLDHMDWMSSYYPDALREEWEAILDRATPHARILLRSAQTRPAWLDNQRVGPENRSLREILRFHDDMADALQPGDRVHTYAGFVIADAPA
jgi:S-adenosylmethionine-diacylglycerol 3-amino-3-carboxypropyl transferase